LCIQTELNGNLPPDFNHRIRGKPEILTQTRGIALHQYPTEAIFEELAAKNVASTMMNAPAIPPARHLFRSEFDVCRTLVYAQD
jgi:hypothetical protein